MSFESQNFGGEINKYEETPEARTEKIKEYTSFVLNAKEVGGKKNEESEEVKRLGVLDQFINGGVIPVELRDEVEHEIVKQIKEKSPEDGGIKNELDKAT